MPTGSILGRAGGSHNLVGTSLHGGHKLNSNQIFLVTFMLSVDTSFIFTKKSNVATWFFDVSNAKVVQCCQKLDVILFSNKIILKLKLSKNLFYKIVVLLFNEKKIRKIWTFLDIEN